MESWISYGCHCMADNLDIQSVIKETFIFQVPCWSKFLLFYIMWLKFIFCTVNTYYFLYPNGLFVDKYFSLILPLIFYLCLLISTKYLIQSGHLYTYCLYYPKIILCYNCQILIPKRLLKNICQYNRYFWKKKIYKWILKKKIKLGNAFLLEKIKNKFWVKIWFYKCSFVFALNT